MSLANLIRKNGNLRLATAIPAIPAIREGAATATVARIATIAVASPTEAKTAKPDEERTAIAEALAWAEDDRRRCRLCLNLRGGVCSIAKPGGLVSANKGYRPANVLLRCAGYSPALQDADQRAGAERWPGLSEGQRDIA
jgi:hypothetical protein